MGLYEDLMNVKSRERDNCCEVRFKGEEKYLAMKEQYLRERTQCCQQVAQANACCCKLRG